MSDNYFTILSQDIGRRLVESGASACEWAVLHSMMHHRPNDRMEIGVNGNYVMSSRDIAEYIGLPSADIARRGIKKLKDRGIIEVSRTVVRNGKRMNVYRLACTGGGDGENRQDYDDVEKDPSCGCTATESVAELPRLSVAGLPHTPISNPVTTQDEKNIGSDVCKNRKRTSSKSVPYPESSDEVYDYAVKLSETIDSAAIDFIVVDGHLVDDFYHMNENNGWVLPDGKPIRDWTKMLVSFAEKVYRDYEQSYAYDSVN